MSSENTNIAYTYIDIYCIRKAMKVTAYTVQSEQPVASFISVLGPLHLLSVCLDILYIFHV